MTRPILVTGGRGQVATALAALRPDGVHVVGRPEFDFDRPETVGQALRAHAPALVVNAAAWTAVDAAEAEPEAARQANERGPAELAAQCRAAGIRLIHISTDYVFDGLKGAPYVEGDPTSPTGIYGATKLAGEQAVRGADPLAVILRTSWVYARTGRNFVLTMMGASRRAPVLRVVADQIGCPTNADDLAQAILQVADALLDAPARQGGRDPAAGGGAPRPRKLRAAVASTPGADARLAAPARPGGLSHAAGAGETSWHGLATAVFEEAARHGHPRPQVQPIATADWPTPARRPPDSRLECGLLHESFGVRLPPWEQSVRSAVAAICATEADGDAVRRAG